MHERPTSIGQQVAASLIRLSYRIASPHTPELRFHDYELMMAVGVFYHEDGQTIKVLAERKKGATYDKSLKLPGGHYEPEVDFSLRRTLLREFNEEMGQGLQTKRLHFIGDKSGRFDDKNIYMRIFAQELSVLPPLIPGEEDIEGYEWVTPEEFKQRSRHTSYRLAVEEWERQFTQR